MQLELRESTDRFLGLSLGLTPDDVRTLIRQLTMLLEDNDQHFHISADTCGRDVFVDVEVFMQDPKDPSDGFISGRAISPTDAPGIE